MSDSLLSDSSAGVARTGVKEASGSGFTASS